jgi:hypothetical protein
VSVELRAAEILDDDWSTLEALSSGDSSDSFEPSSPPMEAPSEEGFGIERYGGYEGDRGVGGSEQGGGAAGSGGWEGEGHAELVGPSQEEIRRELRAVRIEVADFANTSMLSSGEGVDYLKTELGMNIIVPRGKISELRFRVQLEGDPQGAVMAIDGFPKDNVDRHALVEGKVSVGVTKAFKLLGGAAGGALAGPAGAAGGAKVGDVLDELLKIELNPWQFSVGDVRDVKIDFSEANTAQPEWWFKGGEGVMNSLAVVLTLKKSQAVASVTGAVTAFWDYDAGWWHKKAGTETKRVPLYAGS